MEILGTGANILLVLLGFGILVAIHEFGHFAAAKWAGVRVDGFAVGMGPVILAYRQGIGIRFGSTEPTIHARTGKRAMQLTDSELKNLQIGETEYSLRALPLGGFVRMLGQDDLDPTAASVDPRSYNRTPIWKRMIIVSAGVTCNIFLAIAMFVVAFMIGVRFEAPIVGAVMPADPAANAGIQAGDRIVAIDGASISTFADLQIAAAMGKPNEALRMTIERSAGSQTQTIQLNVTPKHSEAAGMMSIGIAPAASTRLMTDSQVIPFLYGVFNRAGFWNHAPDAMPGKNAWGINAANLSGPNGAAPDRESFDKNFRGGTLLMVDGNPATTYTALDDASLKSKGQPIATRWSFVDGGESDIAINCVPVWQILEYTEKPPQAFIDFEQGIFGLTPLVRIGRVPATSGANGILMDDDVILRAADIAGPRQMEFRLAVQEHAGKQINLRVLRKGQEIDCAPIVGRDGKLGVEIANAWETPIIARPFAVVGPPPGVPTSVAALDLMPLTRINAINGQTIGDWNDLFGVVRGALSQNLGLSQLSIKTTPPTPNAAAEERMIQLDSTTRNSLATLRWRPALGPEWFMPADVVLSAGGNPLRAIAMGFTETRKMVMMTYLTLDRLFRGTVGVSQLRGPVGIVHIGTRIADRGMTYLIFFLAMISVNLAVINFLPIPIADGGLMVFLIYEKLRGKPPSPSFQNGAMLAGLVLVGALFAVTFYNDVMRLIT